MQLDRDRSTSRAYRDAQEEQHARERIEPTLWGSKGDVIVLFNFLFKKEFEKKYI
jgi:hypothetical protein